MNLEKTLGGFWSEIPEARELAKALNAIEEQLTQEIRELEHSLSRHNIDIWRKKFWYPLKVSPETLYNTYDSGEAFFYDKPVKTVSLVLPDCIVSAECAQDGIHKYSFSIPIEGRTLTVPANTETVWLKNALIDGEDLYNQFGYALGLKLPSSEAFKELLNALMDARVNGPSLSAFMRGLSAMTGIPVCREEETVLEVKNPQVITDRNTYSVPGEITVKAGDRLQPGDTLSDAIQWNPSLPAIPLDPAFTGICHPVLIPNRDINISTQTENGVTRILLDGMNGDFMQLTHLRGLEGYQQITDSCELEGLEPAPEITLTTASGLGSYMLFHRFN